MYSYVHVGRTHPEASYPEVKTYHECPQAHSHDRRYAREDGYSGKGHTKLFQLAYKDYLAMKSALQRPFLDHMGGGCIDHKISLWHSFTKEGLLSLQLSGW